MKYEDKKKNLSKKGVEHFTIVRGVKKSDVKQGDLDKMNKKYGGWWPKVMDVKN